MKLLAFALLVALAIGRGAAENQCCFGYEQIPGLSDQNCYRMLVSLGPIMQNQARVACGMQFGGSLITFDNFDDIEIVRDYFVKKYKADLENDPKRGGDTGFWTGYSRGNSLSTNFQSDAPFRDQFINSYSGSTMNPDFFRRTQPENLQTISNRSTEACITRKTIMKGRSSNDEGFDDYPCSKIQYAICQLPLAIAGQQNVHIYNGRWQNFQDVPETECTQNWDEDTANFFQLLIAHAENIGKTDLAEQRIAHSKEPVVSLADIMSLVKQSIFQSSVVDMQ